MSEVPVYWGLFVHLPYADALVVRATSHDFVIGGDNNRPDPLFVSVISPGVEPGTDFPQFDSLIAGTADQEVTVHHKVDVADIMIVAMEGFAANIVVI